MSSQQKKTSTTHPIAPAGAGEGLTRWAVRELLEALPQKRDWFNPDAERVLREFVESEAGKAVLSRGDAGSAGGGNRIDTKRLTALPWFDRSSADPIEKARRVLKEIHKFGPCLFFTDGFPRDLLSKEVGNVLEVLNALAIAAAQEGSKP
jgi:hypothetical protein